MRHSSSSSSQPNKTRQPVQVGSFGTHTHTHTMHISFSFLEFGQFLADRASKGGRHRPQMQKHEELNDELFQL